MSKFFKILLKVLSILLVFIGMLLRNDQKYYEESAENDRKFYQRRKDERYRQAMDECVRASRKRGWH